MKNKLVIALIMFVYPISACADSSLKSRIPIEVSSVQTARVGSKLVRVINYQSSVIDNDRKLPFIEIEFIQVPGRERVIDKIEINKVSIDFLGKKTKLDFYNSQMASIEDLQIRNDLVVFKLFYVFTGTAAPSIMVSCEVNVAKEKLTEPACHEIPMEN